MREYESVSVILPERYIDAEIDNKTNQSVEHMITYYHQNFIKVFEPAGLAPVFFGVPGAGKTHAAAALSKILVSMGVEVGWADTVETFNKLLDYRDFRSNSYFRLKNDLQDRRVLVFDDFGQLRDFDRIRELFFQIVNYRYAWKKPTIFTANFVVDSQEDWETKVGGCFNPSLARRIQAMSDGLVVSLT